LLILATSQATLRFQQLKPLPLQQVTGQLDQFACKDSALKTIINGRGYLLPDGTGVWSGATHHRQSSNSPVNCTINAADSLTNQNNVAMLAPQLPVKPGALASFASGRTVSPDRLPVVGAVPDAVHYQKNFRDLKHGKQAKHFSAPMYHRGLYVATAYGSRGAMHAPLIAELIAKLITGQCQRQHKDFLQLLHPARFLQRSLRRGCKQFTYNR